MAAGSIPSFLKSYITHSAYHRVTNRPFVSTFRGGTFSSAQWDTDFRAPLIAAGTTPLFVSNFDDWVGYPTFFVQSYLVVDGAFSWEVVWPGPGTAVASASTTVDGDVLNQVRAQDKLYMMGGSFYRRVATRPTFP
ncbi:glycoside hydrolase family 71 protein [Myriangium duriaei CBS 260.36]|uniref:Glycoside hydrolase family 71 protein n=1 Tax=Myriangium duriaei CBS 260.36 TaxID=1168546 RepID=A0A9P4IXF0_9PEZI|nr:glycoside hydrolase family 71 protein [Myriangium duriaei CBS 260.36]